MNENEGKSIVTLDSKPYGYYLKESIEKDEEYRMKEGIAKIDNKIFVFDTKRVIVEKVRRWCITDLVNPS